MSGSVAERSAAALWAEDGASRWLGITLEEVSEGMAVLSMVVQAHHCNGHGILHGGITYALADSAFAFACNSRNQRTVAQTNTITYLAPGHRGERLTATAREIRLVGRSGVTDVTVTREDGTVIAEFRGQSRAIPGTLYDDEGERS